MVAGSSPESNLRFSHSDDDATEELLSQRTIVKFSSSSCLDSPDRDSYEEEFAEAFRLQKHMPPIYEAIIPDSPFEPLFDPSPISISSPGSLFGLHSSVPSSPASSATIFIPRSPKSNRNQAVLFFLKFHQEAVIPGHYFRYYDYHPLCTEFLPAMADKSEPLQHAIVAFSALIFSTKVNLAARGIAFVYYAKSLQGLRQLLDKSPLSIEECHVSASIALQLLSFDVLC